MRVPGNRKRSSRPMLKPACSIAAAVSRSRWQPPNSGRDPAQPALRLYREHLVDRARIVAEAGPGGGADVDDLPGQSGQSGQ